ncbi:MAG: carboxypeptidase regulatory-like domain-containing protein [Armatimonadetes bacterium]|nr:carboxypeptidase regulatory-like domain-containing protein [Armatimonadota bacterium]
MYRYLALICLVIGIAGCGGGGGGGGGGDAPEGTVTAEGYVKNFATGRGISGAGVRVGGRSSTTNNDGFYRITGVASGIRSLWAGANGYQAYPSDDTINIPDQDVYRIHDILLVPSSGGDNPPPPPF